LVHLLLTLDYEIFGNGAGDVMRDVIHPTDRLLRICERHGAKLTIMFEVGEYWAFERFDDRLRRDWGYSPCGAMRTQATEAIQRGHDVQLHLHPQWIDAKYDEGFWRLSDSCWRLADMPEDGGGDAQITSINGALSKGKRTLEDMIRPVKADYECVCLRAGAFCLQPSQGIIRAMRKVGLRADSSVVKGHCRDVPYAVDYSRVEPNKAAWWTASTEVTREGTPGEGVLELCVSSRMEPYWKSFKPAKLRAALHRRRAERADRDGRANGERRGVNSVPPWRTVLTKMLMRHASTFDFCKLSCKDMLRRIRALDDRRQQPVVMIGHSKDFVNDRQFDKFLGLVSQRGTVLSESIQALLSTPASSALDETVEMGAGKSRTQ